VAARILGVEDRGYLALLALFPAVLAQFGSLGVPLAVTFFVSRRLTEAHIVVRNAARIALAQAAVLVPLHGLVVWTLLAGHGPAVRTAALYTLAAVPASLGQHYGLAVLQGQGRLRAFNLLRVLAPSAYSATVVTLLLVGTGDLPKVTLAWVAANLIVAAAIVTTAALGIPPAGSGHIGAKALVGFGLKSLLGSASPIDTFRLDQAVVGLLLSPAALGIYVVGMAFTNLPRFVAQSIGLVSYPAVARERDERQRVSTMWRFVFLATLVAAVLVGALELLAGRLVLLFFGEEFEGAVSVARILLIGAFFLSVRRVVTDGARGAGRTAAGSVAEVGSWLVLGPALLLLAPRFGAEGVAAAVALSSGLSLAMLLIVVLRRRDTPSAAHASATAEGIGAIPPAVEASLVVVDKGRAT
jgi:O-antigen/teichoic acid export membrane protein